MAHEFSIEYARQLDSRDALRPSRDQFHLPRVNGREAVYFLGNSLGLQPKSTRGELMKVMDAWASQGVEGFFAGSDPWIDCDKPLTRILATIVGAGQEEIVVMNHLTVNLHFLMISFYRPTAKRFKIICEAKAFPSDQYAFRSQVKLHGYDPDEAIIEVAPREGNNLVAHEDIVAAITDHGESVAMVLFSGVNYYTGQLFDIKAITAAAHEIGAYAGFDLAHAAGNVQLNLHDWGVGLCCLVLL
jgi:kynureninase